MIEMNGVAELSDHNFITSYDIEHIVGKAIYVCTEYFFLFIYLKIIFSKETEIWDLINLKIDFSF